jgi:hypothetical protein
MTDCQLQTSTMFCYRVDLLYLKHEIPGHMYAADLSEGLPLWRVAQLVQEEIDDYGLVVGVREEGEGVVIAHYQVDTSAHHTPFAMEEAYFYRLEWRELKDGSLATMYVANASNDVPLWRIAELMQNRIGEQGFIVAIDDVRTGLALLPPQDAAS